MALLFARQPIFNRRNKLYGYELLYREEGHDGYSFNDGDVATSNVMAAGFLSMDVGEISGKKKAFINFTEKMLLNQVATLFPKEQIVVEVLEDIEPSPQVVAACKSLKAEGYTIALDDFVFRPGYEAFIEIADVVKVDFRLTATADERRNVVEKLRNGKIKFLAEKIETHEEFEFAARAGYELFQGYYFSRPVVTASKGIPPAKMNHIKLIKLLESNDTGFEEISRIIEKDVAFSYEILRIANTAYYYRGHKTVSIRQAAVRLGLEELKKWAFITVLRKLGGEAPDAIVNLSAQRGKIMELLSCKMGLEGRKTEFFTLGLLSMVDVLAGSPMETLLPELPVSEEAKGILLGSCDDGKMCFCFRLTLAYEKGDWDKIFSYTDRCGVGAEEVAQAYFEAVVWTNSFDLG